MLEKSVCKKAPALYRGFCNLFYRADRRMSNFFECEIEGCKEKYDAEDTKLFAMERKECKKRPKAQERNKGHDDK